MTRDVIVDASVSAKWFVAEERSDVARRILGSGTPLHAPDFMVLEFAAVMWKKVRTGTISPSDAGDLLRTLRQAPVALHATGPLTPRALEIALATRATVYDSTYVALAEARNGRLVTEDEALAVAMQGTRWEVHVVLLRSWDSDRLPP